jgi:hypothetical protein
MLPSLVLSVAVSFVAGMGPAKQKIELLTGVTLAYFEMGNPDGEPVLFLHGYTDTSREGTEHGRIETRLIAATGATTSAPRASGCSTNRGERQVR